MVGCVPLIEGKMPLGLGVSVRRTLLALRPYSRRLDTYGGRAIDRQTHVPSAIKIRPRSRGRIDSG
jgi:hypothetical protein